MRTMRCRKVKGRARSHSQYVADLGTKSNKSTLLITKMTASLGFSFLIHIMGITLVDIIELL